MQKTYLTNMKEFLKDFTAENMWHEAKELANRWNGFPCYEQSNLPKHLKVSTNFHFFTS